MRRRGLRSTKLQITNHKLQIPQRGYMMITLMLALAMITIALLTVLPEMKQQIRRDREEELRHRGTEYMRAIQHFYKKFQRYPARIEELDNTNNLRFLRKRYTDPVNRDRVTGKERDFKLLHQADISLNNGPVLGPIPGGAQPGGLQSGGLQATSNAGTTNQESGDSADSSSSNSSSSNSSSSNSSPAGGNLNPPGSPSASGLNSNSSSGFNGPTFGGGPILGVASASKEKTIREFYQKNHYKDWLFIYVPQADRGGLLNGPVNPSMPMGNLNGPTNPAPGGNLPAPGLMPNTIQPQNPPVQPPQPPAQMPEQ